MMDVGEPVQSQVARHSVGLAQPAPEGAPENASSPLPDCGGTCFPQAAGSSADLAASLWAKRQQQRALALTEVWAGRRSGWWGRYLEALHRLLLDMPAAVAVAAFRPAVVGLALSRQSGDSEAMTSALGLIRFLVGGPNQQALTLVIPAEAFGPSGRLYFPHLHAVVESRGPLAVEADASEVRFTWIDGAGATLAAAPAYHGAGQSGQRVTLLPSVLGWRVLNGNPDLEAPIEELPVQPAPLVEPAWLDNLVNGARLLRQVWPVAALAARRYLDSVILQPLPAEGHVTSVTLGRLQGSLIASLRDPVQVADALCHEGSHTRLGLFLQMDPLIEDDEAAVHPSPWRQDPRPLKGLLNGVHAFVNVCEFYRRLALAEPTLAEPAEAVYSVQRRRVLEAWDYLEPRLRPTRLGQTLVAELAAAVRGLR